MVRINDSTINFKTSLLIVLSLPLEDTNFVQRIHIKDVSATLNALSGASAALQCRAILPTRGGILHYMRKKVIEIKFHFFQLLLVYKSYTYNRWVLG